MKVISSISHISYIQNKHALTKYDTLYVHMSKKNKSGSHLSIYLYIYFIFLYIFSSSYVSFFPRSNLAIAVWGSCPFFPSHFISKMDLSSSCYYYTYFYIQTHSNISTTNYRLLLFFIILSNNNIRLIVIWFPFILFCLLFFSSFIKIKYK